MNVFKGAVGIAKSRIGIDAASKYLTSLRRGICAECPERSGWFCKMCLCLIHEKSRVKSEKCPLDLW